MSEEIEDMALRLASPAELREMVQTLTLSRNEAVGKVVAIVRVLGLPVESDGTITWETAENLVPAVQTLTRERDEARAMLERIRTEPVVQELEQALARLVEEP